VSIIFFFPERGRNYFLRFFRAGLKFSKKFSGFFDDKIFRALKKLFNKF